MIQTASNFSPTAGLYTNQKFSKILINYGTTFRFSFYIFYEPKHYQTSYIILINNLTNH